MCGFQCMNRGWSLSPLGAASKPGRGQFFVNFWGKGSVSSVRHF